MYGNAKKNISEGDVDISKWKRAHLLPIVTPQEAPELHTLEQDKDEVIQAVRNGYAAAFDMLAPIVGVTLDSKMNGKRMAELMFPTQREMLENKVESLIYKKRRKHAQRNQDEHRKRYRGSQASVRWKSMAHF